MTCKPSSGSRFPLGQTKVSCTATDSYANTVGKSFTITVVDTTPPAVAVPADFAVNAVSPEGAPVAFTVAATDLVSGTLAVSCSPASGGTFPIGDTTVTCTAFDRAGNTGTATFTVHVKSVAEQLEDTRTTSRRSTSAQR